ncbi:uncharacterized protein SAPINGB_P006137 [Magnusiomyces paraingens]|uniref:Uncharacterized protein n=1 Tax=Magnusiomyces paraingens TaxID=2606893 RepID=A0A5E8C5F4_9ASCO|nr:uncharacterized protein SAPINGB_P006137 [Saprochaete ingens]VVT58300.1 unnamed protein product [Saprochaete ingens]
MSEPQLATSTDGETQDLKLQAKQLRQRLDTAVEQIRALQNESSGLLAENKYLEEYIGNILAPASAK